MENWFDFPELLVAAGSPLVHNVDLVKEFFSVFMDCVSYGLGVGPGGVLLGFILGLLHL